MSLLDRYMAKRFLGTLARILLSLVLLFVLIDLLTHRQDNIIKYEIPLHIVLVYYLAFVPTILFEYQAAALSVLIAGLLVFGRAAQENEVTAALAGGIPLSRLVRMPVLFAALLALGAFAIQETVGVQAAVTTKRIEREYFSRSSVENRQGVSWVNLGDGWTCHVLKFNRIALTGQDVHIHSVEDALVQEVRAERIFWDEESRQWLLEDGLWCTLYPEDGWTQRVDRITQQEAPFSDAPEDLFALDTAAEAKTPGALKRDLRRAAFLGTPVRQHWVDYHVKFARPALCFVMIWLAIPFAIRLRRGSIAIGFGVSIAIGLAYMLLFFITTGLGHMGELPPLPAAWIANIVFLAVGLFLFRKTPT